MFMQLWEAYLGLAEERGQLVAIGVLVVAVVLIGAVVTAVVVIVT